MVTPTPLRLGSVPYLNALPLVTTLAAEPRVALSTDVPSRLAPRLRSGELDAALVSAVELFRAEPLGWVAGPAIVSRGAVRSILVFLRRPLAELRSLALDSSSLSAAAMTQVCLRRLLGAPTLSVRRCSPELPLEEIDADAILRIGDPALRTDPGAREVLDLGEIWTRHTGLPFVYALWLVRSGVVRDELDALLREAAGRGLPRRDELARRFAREHAMSEEDCAAYLAGSIHYELDAEARAGLELFGRLAHGLELVDRGALPASGDGST